MVAFASALQMMDLRQSPNYAEFMSKRGWVVRRIPPFKKTKANVSSIFAYIKKVPLFPLSVMKIQRFQVLPDFKEIGRFVREYHVISVTLEPSIILGISDSQINSKMRQHGFRRGREPLLPTKTAQVELLESQIKIFSNIKKDARASIQKARSNCSVEIVNSNDRETIDRLHLFWKKNGKGYIPSLSEFKLLLDVFSDKSLVVASYKKDQLLAGAVILNTKDYAYYYYAFTSPFGRRLFSGYLVVWEAMMQAKKRGCKSFDFEGIYDERFPQLKRWKGFSTFKKKFGGKEIYYPGPFIRYFFPFK